MEKYIVLYGCGGYDGDDCYCFGNADIVAVRDTRAEAETEARNCAQAFINDFVEADLEIAKEECPESFEAYKKTLINTVIDLEEEVSDDGELSAIYITHSDEMFPHAGTIRITKVAI